MTEALADEAGLTVDSVTLTEEGGTARLTAIVSTAETTLTAEVTLQ